MRSTFQDLRSVWYYGLYKYDRTKMDVKSFPILHEMKIVHGTLNANPFFETGLQIWSLLRSLLTSGLSFLENTLFRIYFSSFIPKVNYSDCKINF